MNLNTENANPDDEQLTAYLDGELPDEARSSVETRLAVDETFRQRLHELQRTWDVLDELPKPKVDHSFTQSTLEIVVADAKNAGRQSGGIVWRDWALRIFVFGFVPALSMIASYYLIQNWQDRSNRELLQQLPVIDNVDVYLKAQNAEFVDELKDSGLFEQNLELFDEGAE